MSTRKALFGACASLALALAPTPAPALQAGAPTIVFSLEPQDLGAALTAVARLTGREIIISADAVDRRRSPRLSGRYTADEAIQRLLEGSGLVAEFRADVVLVKPATSATNPEADQAQSEDIVVTGSSIRGIVPAGSPSTVIDRDAIDRSGYATTQQVLQALPQAYRGGPNEGTFGVSSVNGSELGEWQGASINLRGLGAGSTLTLVNGHRIPLGGYGAFSDISLIPSSAIERIEVLTDGASAIYGSDAVAGVANIKLRDRFDGAETRARFGTADGDANEVQASQLIGREWGGGHVLLAYEFYHRGSLAASERDFATEDLRAFGGADYRTGYGIPGSIIADGDYYGIPSGQDGTSLTPDQLIPGQRNRGDTRAGSDLLPRQTRHSLYASAEQQATPALSFFGDFLYSRRMFHSRPRLDISEQVVVPATNPFYVDPIGTGEPVTVEYDFSRDLGHLTRDGYVETWSSTFGSRLEIGAWAFQAYGVVGGEKDVDRLVNYLNSEGVARALADPDPATALNVFGDGSYVNSPATLESIRGRLGFDGDYNFWSATAKADGPLVALPAGDARLAIGAEYRRESVRSTIVLDAENGGTEASPFFDFPDAREVTAAFGELFIPVIGEANRTGWLNRLDLSLAARVERYSDVGTTANPKLGLTWEPLTGLRLRSSYGTSFRAPPFLNLIQSPTYRFYVPVPLPDPASPTGQSIVLVVLGNDPALGPERARTWTVGADIRPAFAPGVRASLTFYSISYRNRIVDPSGSLNSFLTDRATYSSLLNEAPTADQIADIYAQPEFANPFGFAPSEVEIIANAQVQNLASVKQQGLDFDLGYTFTRGAGRGEIGLDGSYIFHIRQAITPEAAVSDQVNTIGYPVDLKLRGRASWSAGAWGVSAFYNYTSGYRNTLIVARPKVDSYGTADLQITYDLPAALGPLAGTKLALSATNVFDRGPPFVEYATGTTAIGYDPENASALGRSVSLQLTKQW